MNQFKDLNLDLVNDLVDDLNQLFNLGNQEDKLMVQINLFNISKINGQHITGLKNHKDYKK